MRRILASFDMEVICKVSTDKLLLAKQLCQLTVAFCYVAYLDRFVTIFTIPHQDVETQFAGKKDELENSKEHDALKMVISNYKILPLVNLKQINITNFFNTNNRT